jgi:hypothetical protein
MSHGGIGEVGNTLPADEDFQLIRIVNCPCKLFFNHAAGYLRARCLRHSAFGANL